jgi:PAS domain S-box-containing protein
MTTQQVSGWSGFRQSNGDARADLVTTDIIDILDTIDVPIVVIGRSFMVASFNRAAAEVLRLEPSDIGLSPRDTLVLVGLVQLEEWCAEVMATGAARRHDFRHGDKSFVVRISPFIRSKCEIGTVLTFTNVTAFRASVAQAIYEREYTKTILNTIADPIVVLSPDLRVQAGNQAFYTMFGVSRDQTQDVPLYKLMNHAFELPQLRTQLEGTLTGGHAFQPFEMNHDFPVIGPRTIVIDARPFTLPHQSTRMIVLVFHDITARKRSEATGAYLASIVESLDDAIVSKSLDGIINSWNKGAERLFGYAAEEVIGKSITILIPEDRREEEEGILECLRRGQRIDHYETVRQRKDGSLVEISLTVSPVKAPDGRVIGASKCARDISQRKEAERRQHLLLREMNHRIKNLFTLAGGLITLSARSAATPKDLAEAVRGRLAALARAHDLTLCDLADRKEGPDRAIALPTLIHTIVAPYLSEGHASISLNGPEVPISGKAVTDISLLLHEFATNAAKYGALSSQSGHVDVNWSACDGELLLTWQEHGGPPVNGQPEREGFGSLLARLTLSQFGGKMCHDWNPRGVTINFSAPLERLMN